MFKDDPSSVHYFEIQECNPDGCCGIRELTLSQAEVFINFLSELIPEAPKKPGITNLTEHVIDVGRHPPIKQRHYLVSPKMMEIINQEVD